MPAIKSMKESSRLLLEWMRLNIRRSEEVCELAEPLLLDIPKCFGNKVWLIYEYVYIAAIDCNHQRLIKICWEELNKKFSNSSRVLILKGFKFEMFGEYEEAIQLYDQVLKDDESNERALKRKIAIYKAQGNNCKAVEGLVEYLDTYQTDYEAWLQLAQLYIQQLRFDFAAFCLEEVIAGAPYYDGYFVYYGEILYAQTRTNEYTGKAEEKLILAKKYFLKALEMNPSNLRALYGVLMVVANLNSLGICTEGMQDFVKHKFSAVYQKSELLPYLSGLLSF
jgi:tetratricopeptide (TPR) repeat protein